MTPLEIVVALYNKGVINIAADIAREDVPQYLEKKVAELLAPKWEVIDLTLHEDEGNKVFAGTQEECNEFICEQCHGGVGFTTYSVVPIIS